MYQDHVKALVAAWSEGNLRGLDGYLSPTTVRRAPAALNSNANNLGELKQVITDFRASFPDAKVTITELFFQDNRSFARWGFTGTNTGPGQFPATGKSVKIEGASIARYDGGKLTEELVYFDALDMLAQLGLVSMPSGG